MKKSKNEKGHESREDNIVVREGGLETPNPGVITWRFLVSILLKDYGICPEPL